MFIGQTVIIRNKGNLVEGIITEIFPEEVSLHLQSGESVNRKVWEIRRIDIQNED